MSLAAHKYVVQNHQCFLQFEIFDSMESRTSNAFKLEHVPWALLDMLNTFEYLPTLVIVSAGGSEFGAVSSSVLRGKVQRMVFSCRDLMRAAQPYAHNCSGVLYNALVDLPDYVGWESQRCARKARSRFNSVLGKYASAAGHSVILHHNISSKDPDMFISPAEDLSVKGLKCFCHNVADRVFKLKRISATC